MGVVVIPRTVEYQPNLPGPFTRWIGGCRLMAAFNNVGVPQSIGDISLVLPKAGGADWAFPNTGIHRPRGVLADVDGAGFQATAPEFLKMPWPVTIIMGVCEIATPEASGSHFVCGLPGGSPFISWGFVGASAGDLTRIGVAVSSGATFTDLRASLITAPLTAGRHYILGVSLRPGVQEMYQDGVFLASAASGFVGGNPTYTNAIISFADGTLAATRNPHTLYTFGYIFSGYGGPGLHRSIADNPWQVFDEDQMVFTYQTGVVTTGGLRYPAKLNGIGTGGVFLGNRLH